jgi:hypothetical protein
MDVEVRHTRLEGRLGPLVGGEGDAVDDLLALGEPAVDRHGRGQVAGVMEGGLGPAIEQEHPAAAQGFRLSVLVQDLSVDGRDDGERQVSAGGPGHLVDGRGDLGLGHGGPGHPQGCEMHIDGYVDGLFDLGDLLGRLDGPLFDDGPNERHRRLGRGAVGLDPQPGQQLQLVLGPVRRQKMDRASGLPEPLQVLFQAGRGQHARHTRQSGPILERRQGTRPDEVLDRQLGAVEGLRAFVQIEDRGQAGGIEPEIIKEGAVLAETIGVVRIVHRAFVVAQEQRDPLSQLPAQPLSSRAIDIPVEHDAPPRSGRGRAACHFLICSIAATAALTPAASGFWGSSSRNFLRFSRALGRSPLLR